MPVVKLSQDFITQHLQCPEGKDRIEYCDTELPGMYVEVRSTSQGQGTYYLRYKDRNGKTCHQKVGRTSEVELADARKQAKTLKAEISLGADPRATEKAKKEVLTFSDFFEDHYLPYVKPRKRSWKRDDELYTLRIKEVFGHKRLNQITRQQIQTFHTELLTSGLAPAKGEYPPEIRRVIYTTNAIESVNMSLRKITKNRGSFPSDDALLKLFYLALRNISQKWTMPIRDWKAALIRFTIQFEERMTQH